MLELARDLLPILEAGESVAVVTVVRVARSAPRGVGASMAVTRDARVIGSISGGCVESEAIALALSVLATGEVSVPPPSASATRPPMRRDSRAEAPSR